MRATGLFGGLLVMAAILSSSSAALGGEGDAEKAWTMPAVSLKTPVTHPVIACTAAELARLKTAWASKGTAHDVMAKRFAQADEAMAKELVFPPEGGQHNQWYQCEPCQIALKTVDAHHHQCPKCGKVYGGFPYDNVLYSRQHSTNLARMEDAAWAWAVTGEKKYAQFAAKVMVGYAERYLKYPMVVNSVSDKTVDVSAEKKGKYKTAGHINEQTLGEAMYMIPLATAYDLVCDSGALSEADRRNVEQNFIRAMAECIDVYRAGKSNWQTWHNAALLWAGAVLGDEAMVRQALTGPANGFAYQMGLSVMPEGMWYENSWGYHYYTLTAMTHIAEGARRLGLDLYRHPLLRKMYTLAFDYLMADGSLPRFGDAVQDSPSRPSVNEEAYAAYGDERILATLSEEPSWDGILLGRDLAKKAMLPAGKSGVFPGAGHAILRTGGPGKLSAAMTFGPYGGFHGHYDKLSFVLFGYGQEMAVDPGRAASQAYRLPIHRQWYKASVGHNVVLVDGKGQKEAGGKLLGFAADDSYAAVAADAGPAFENVVHRRLVILTPSYLLVVDRLAATDDKEHVFEWVYHNAGTKIACDLPKGEGKLEGDAGYKYVQGVEAYKVEKDGSFAVTVTGEKASAAMRIVGQAGDVVFTGTGPLKSVDDRAPMVVVRRKGKVVYFCAAIEPLGEKGEPQVKQVAMLGDAAGAHGCRLHNDPYVDEVSFGEKDDFGKAFSLVCKKKEDGPVDAEFLRYPPARGGKER